MEAFNSVLTAASVSTAAQTGDTVIIVAVIAVAAAVVGFIFLRKKPKQ